MPRRRWLVPAALVCLLPLLGGPSANGAGVIPPPWPGLPTLSIPDGWVKQASIGDQGDGLSEVARARQWIKIPAQAVGAELENSVTRYPADDPQGRETFTPVTAALYLSSPKGATAGYGIGLPVTVHTVAFGAIPIQVGLQLEQLRDADDLPVPLQLSFGETVYWHPQQVRPGFSSQEEESAATVTGEVRVRLTSLSADGVDVGLGDCVSAPIELDLHGKPYWVGDPLLDPHTQSFEVGSTESSTWAAARGIGTTNGGGISGTIDLPAFSHCLTKSGEDLAPLLTSAISGPGNAVTIGWGALSGTTASHQCGTVLKGTTVVGIRGPFQGDPSDCDPDFGPPALDYPARTP